MDSSHLLEKGLVAHFISLEQRRLYRIKLIQIPVHQFVLISTCSETHFWTNQLTVFVFVKVFVWTEKSLIELAGKLSSVYLVKIKDFIGLEMSGNTQTLCYFFRLQLCSRQIFFSLRYKKVSAFLVALFFKIKNARISTVVEIHLLVFLLTIVVYISHVFMCDIQISRRRFVHLKGLRKVIFCDVKVIKLTLISTWPVFKLVEAISRKKFIVWNSFDTK